jgi:hypothetical protein
LGLHGRQVFAYDQKMRRFFLCFLLCLMPLRLWAGAWMTMPESSAHHLPTQVHASAMPQAGLEAQAAHDCHESMAPSQAVSDDAHPRADCHDATCQLCGVCHQSATLAWWPLVLPVFQSHPLPIGEARQPAGRATSPLIKPPIS